jgi:hypothetical protein
MAAPRLRPTFEISVELSAREVVDRVKERLGSVRGSIVATFIAGNVEVVPDPSLVHFWSPQLTLRLDEADGTTLIHGRFAPHPHVWTLYVAIHALGAFGTIGAAMFGLSQYLAGQSPWALWALPISPVLAALVWALGFVGQGLGNEQMYALRRFVEESLGIHGC